MATHHLLAKRPVPQSFSLPRVILILTLLNQSIACNLGSVILTDAVYVAFSRQGKPTAEMVCPIIRQRERKRSQENLFKPF